MTIWSIVEKVSPLGPIRAESFPVYDKRFGIGNWRLAWSVQAGLRVNHYDFLGACAIYEDAYYAYLSKHPAVVAALVKEASDVCAFHTGDTASGLDYTVQRSPAIHVHDIAIRRCLVRLGQMFEGLGVIQVGLTVSLPFGRMLAPGKVPFHKPDWFRSLSMRKDPHDGVTTQMHVPPWDKPYEMGSVEDFFVRNCWLQEKVVPKKA